MTYTGQQKTNAQANARGRPCLRGGADHSRYASIMLFRVSTMPGAW